MKRDTFIQRVDQSLTTHKGDIYCKYIIYLQKLLQNPGFTFRSFEWSSYGRTAKDKTVDIIDMLDALGLSYVHGNDAPRGGRNGDYIVLTSSARRALRGAVKGLFVYRNRLYCYDGELPADTPVTRDLLKEVITFNDELLDNVMGGADVVPLPEVLKGISDYYVEPLKTRLKFEILKQNGLQ